MKGRTLLLTLLVIVSFTACDSGGVPAPPLPGTVHMLSPNGGEVWRVDKVKMIRWEVIGQTSPRNIVELVSASDGQIWGMGTGSVTNPELSWQVGYDEYSNRIDIPKEGKQFRMRVRDTEALKFDDSDTSFTILPKKK